MNTTNTAATCPVLLGRGRRSVLCGRPASHLVINWHRRSTADQRYSVCCAHAPGPLHTADNCPRSEP